MPYTTRQALLDRFGAEELAAVATPREFNRPPPALLRALINDGDLSAWSEEEIAAAGEAAYRMQVAVDDAEHDINFYIGTRYSLPLSPVPATLTRVASDIARFRLYDDHATEEVRQRYKDALRMLEQIAQGKLDLGIAEPQATGGAPDFRTPGRLFTHSTLEDL